MLRLIRSFLVFAEQLAVVDEVALAVRRVITHLCLTLLAVTLIVGSAACGATSLWLWADSRFGPIRAPLFVAAALLLLAAIVFAFMAWSRSQARRSRADRAARAVQDLAQAPSRLLNLAAEGFIAGLTGARSTRA
jgi:hypothetical protein